MDEYANDAIGAALKTRRIPHGRSKKGKGHHGVSSFDPLRARGRYDLNLGSGKSRDRDSEATDSWLEVHELTNERDALLGTFCFVGKERGICVLSGSRKSLANAVQVLDSSAEAERDEPPDDDEGKQDIGNAEETGSDSSDYQDQTSDEKSVSNLEEDEENQNTKSFRKNTFRTPKFWMTWRVVDTERQDTSAKRSAYLIFSGNDCQRVEGTITSSAQGWNNLKLRGRKVHSKASPCPIKWSDAS